MYGTVARLRFEPANLSGIIGVLRSHDMTGVDGFVSAEVVAGSTPGEAWLVARFRDAAAYAANADSPGQNARYLELRSLLSADPEWHDGECHTV